MIFYVLVFLFKKKINYLLIRYFAFSSLFLKAYVLHLLFFAAKREPTSNYVCFYFYELSFSIYFPVFGLYLISLLCYHHSFNIIIIFFFFCLLFCFFGRFDECLIFSLIVSLWCEFFFKEWEWHLFFSLFLWLLSLTNYFTGFFVIEKYGNLKL